MRRPLTLLPAFQVAFLFLPLLLFTSSIPSLTATFCLIQLEFSRGLRIDMNRASLRTHILYRICLPFEVIQLHFLPENVGNYVKACL